MIRYLLPRQLAKATAMPSGTETVGAFASAIAESFDRAAHQLRRAGWLSLPISLLGLLPSIFLLQVYNRVIARGGTATLDRKSTRLNSSHLVISYAVFCLKKI